MRLRRGEGEKFLLQRTKLKENRGLQAMLILNRFKTVAILSEMFLWYGIEIQDNTFHFQTTVYHKSPFTGQ